MSFVDILPLPGILTDQESSSDQGKQDPRWQRAHGYEWVAFQVYNPAVAPKTRNLQPAKDAGMHAGVWGAMYDRATFYEDGKAYAKKALDVGAEFLIVDAEDVSKFTRATRGCKPIIDGLRAGGWAGPVHLTQMGCPVNPRTATNPNGNDYQCDEQSFLETGGGILPQEYANEDESYSPLHALPYWLACGVPAWRLNHTIAVYPGAAGRISGADWAVILQSAGIGRNFSIFMAEMLQPFDAEGLDHQTTLPAPKEPIVTNDAPARNAQVASITQAWLDNFGPASLSRMRLEHDIAVSPDDVFYAVRQDLRDAMDGKTAQLRDELSATKLLLSKTKDERDVAQAALSIANAKIEAARAALA